MKLRILLMVLSLFAFLSVSVAGYLYYSSLKESAFREAGTEIAVQAERTRSILSSFLSGNLKTVKALAGLREVRRALVRPSGDSMAQANAALDHFRDSLEADVCFLMDAGGTTVASSNRDIPDSFVGKNFSFRPCWRRAVGGSPASYMGLGVASDVRGDYSSHPIYGEGQRPPVGVAAIKASFDRIEEEFRRPFEGIVLLADPSRYSRGLEHQVSERTREIQVLRGLAQGESNREIAEAYAISIKTVDTYRYRLLRKLNLRNNAELTRFAIQNRLVEL